MPAAAQDTPDAQCAPKIRMSVEEADGKSGVKTQNTDTQIQTASLEALGSEVWRCKRVLERKPFQLQNGLVAHWLKASEVQTH